MERYQYVFREFFMFLLQRAGVAADDRAQDLQQLRQTIVLLFLVNDKEQEVHHLLADVRAQWHVLAVDSVENCLQVVPLPRILGIKELQKLHYK